MNGIRRTIGTAVTAAAGPALRVRRSGLRTGGVLLCGPPSAGRNRGDEALLRALVGRCAGIPGAELVQTGPPDLAVLPPGLPALPVHADLHQAFNTHQATRERLRFAALAGRFEQVLAVGADLVDDGYGNDRGRASLETLLAAARGGVPCRLVGFSVNEVPGGELGRLFRELGERGALYPRDPLSFRRLKEAGVANVRLAGDLAFLMEPASAADLPVGTEAFTQRHPGGTIGVNLIRKVLGRAGEPDWWHEPFALALARLAEERDAGLLLLPHDDVEDLPDLRAFAAVLRRHAAADHVHLIDPVPNAPVLKALAGRCGHVVSCRLHLAIAALGSGVPVTCFPYQGKFEGQFEHLELSPDGLLPVAELPADPDRLTDRLRARLNRTDEIAGGLRIRLPAIRTLAKKNFEGLGNDPAGGAA